MVNTYILESLFILAETFSKEGKFKINAENNEIRRGLIVARFFKTKKCRLIN